MAEFEPGTTRDMAEFEPGTTRDMAESEAERPSRRRIPGWPFVQKPEPLQPPGQKTDWRKLLEPPPPLPNPMMQPFMDAFNQVFRGQSPTSSLQAPHRLNEPNIDPLTVRSRTSSISSQATNSSRRGPLRADHTLQTPRSASDRDAFNQAFRGQSPASSLQAPHRLNEPNIDLLTFRSRTSSISSQATNSSRRGPLRADHTLQTPRSASDREIEEINRLAEQAVAFNRAPPVQPKPRPNSMPDIAKLHPTYYTDITDDTDPSLEPPLLVDPSRETDLPPPRKRKYKILKATRRLKGPVFGRYSPCLSDNKYVIYVPYGSERSRSAGSVEREAFAASKERQPAARPDDCGSFGGQVAAPHGVRTLHTSPVWFVDNEKDAKQQKERSTNVVPAHVRSCSDHSLESTTTNQASGVTQHPKVLHQAVTDISQREVGHQGIPGSQSKGVECSDSGSGSENESSDEDAQDCTSDRRAQDRLGPSSDRADDVSGTRETGSRRQSADYPATDRSCGPAATNPPTCSNLSPVDVPAVRSELQLPTSSFHSDPQQSSKHLTDTGLKSTSLSGDPGSSPPKFPKDFLSQKNKSSITSVSSSDLRSQRTSLGLNDCFVTGSDSQTKSFVKKKKKKSVLANWFSPKKGRYFPNDESVQSLKTVVDFHESNSDSKVRNDKPRIVARSKSHEREERTKSISDTSPSVAVIEDLKSSGTNKPYVFEDKVVDPVCEATAGVMDGESTRRSQGSEAETQLTAKQNAEETPRVTMMSERHSLESNHQASSEATTTHSVGRSEGKLSLLSAKVLRGSNSPGAYENTSVTINSQVTRHEIITIRGPTLNPYEKSVVFNDSGFPDELSQTFKATPVVLKDGKVSPGSDSQRSVTEVDRDGGAVRLSPTEDLDLFSKASRIVQAQRLELPHEGDAQSDEPELVVIREYVFAAKSASSGESKATLRSSSHTISSVTSPTADSPDGQSSPKGETVGGVPLTSPDLHDSGLELTTSTRQESKLAIPVKPKRTGRTSQEIDESRENFTESDKGQEAASKQNEEQPNASRTEQATVTADAADGSADVGAVSGKEVVEKEHVSIVAAKPEPSSVAATSSGTKKPTVLVKPPLTIKPQVGTKPHVATKQHTTVKPQVTTKPHATTKRQVTKKPQIASKLVKQAAGETTPPTSLLTKAHSTPAHATAVEETSKEDDDYTITVDASSKPSHIVTMKAGESDDAINAFCPQAFLNKLFADQPTSESAVKTVRTPGRPVEQRPHQVSAPQAEEAATDTNVFPRKKPIENIVEQDTDSKLSSADLSKTPSDKTVSAALGKTDNAESFTAKSTSADTYAVPQKEMNASLDVDDRTEDPELPLTEASVYAIPDKKRKVKPASLGNDVNDADALGSDSVQLNAKVSDTESDTQDTVVRSKNYPTSDGKDYKSDGNASTEKPTDEEKLKPSTSFVTAQSSQLNEPVEIRKDKDDEKPPTETVKEEHEVGGATKRISPLDTDPSPRRGESQLHNQPSRCRDSLTDEEYTKPWSNDFSSIEEDIRNKITSAFPPAMEREEEEMEAKEVVSTKQSFPRKDHSSKTGDANMTSTGDPESKETNNSQASKAESAQLRPPSTSPRKMSDPKPGRQQLPIPPPPPSGPKISREEAKPMDSKIPTEEARDVCEDITQEEAKPAPSRQSNEDTDVSHQKAHGPPSEDKNHHHTSRLKEKFMKVFSHSSEDKKASKAAEHQGKKKSSPFTRKKVIKGIGAGEGETDVSTPDHHRNTEENDPEGEQGIGANTTPRQIDDSEVHSLKNEQQVAIGNEHASSVARQNDQDSNEGRRDTKKSRDEDEPKTKELKGKDNEDETERKEVKLTDEAQTQQTAEGKPEPGADPDPTVPAQRYVHDVKLPLSPRQAKKLIKAEKKKAARAQQQEEATLPDDPAAKAPNKALKWIKKKLATKGKKSPVSKKYNINTSEQDEDEADAQITTKADSTSAAGTDHGTSASEDSSDSSSSDESDDSEDEAEKVVDKDAERKKMNKLPFWGGKKAKKKKAAKPESDSDTSADESRFKLFSWSLGRKRAADSSDHEDNLPGGFKKSSDWNPGEDTVGVSGNFRKISDDIPQATTKLASSEVNVGRKKGVAEPPEDLKPELSAKVRAPADSEDAGVSPPPHVDEQEERFHQEPVTKTPRKTKQSTETDSEQRSGITHQVIPPGVSGVVAHFQPAASSVSSPPTSASRPKFTIVGGSDVPASEKRDIGDYTRLRIDASGPQPVLPKAQRLSKHNGYELAHPFLLDEYSAVDKQAVERTENGRDAQDGVTEEPIVPVQAARPVNEAFNSLKKQQGDVTPQRPGGDSKEEPQADSGRASSQSRLNAKVSPPSTVLGSRVNKPALHVTLKLKPTRQAAVDIPVVEDEIVPQNAEEESRGLKLSPNFKRQPLKPVMAAGPSDSGSIVSDSTDLPEDSPRSTTDSSSSPGRGTYLDKTDFLDTAKASWRVQELKGSLPHTGQVPSTGDTELQPDSDVPTATKPHESRDTPDTHSSGNVALSYARDHVSEQATSSAHRKPDIRPKPLPKPVRPKNNDSASSSALSTSVDTTITCPSTSSWGETNTDSVSVDEGNTGSGDFTLSADQGANQKDPPSAPARFKKRNSSGKEGREHPVNSIVHTRDGVDHLSWDFEEGDTSILSAGDDTPLTDVTPLPHAANTHTSTPACHSTPMSDLTTLMSCAEVDITTSSFSVIRASSASSDTRTDWDESCIYEPIFFDDVKDPSSSRQRPEAPPVRPEKGKKRQVSPIVDPAHYDDDADNMYDVPPSRRAFAFPRETSLPVVSVVDKRISKYSPRSRRDFDPEPEDSILPYATYFRPQSSDTEEGLSKEDGCPNDYDDDIVEYAHVSEYPLLSPSSDTKEGKSSEQKAATEKTEKAMPVFPSEETNEEDPDSVEYARVLDYPIGSSTSGTDEAKADERKATDKTEESTPVSPPENAKENDQYLESAEYAHSVEEINKLYAALEMEEKEMERRERSESTSKLKATQKTMERMFSYEDQRARLKPLSPKADDEPEDELYMNQTQAEPKKSSGKKKNKTENKSYSFTEVRTLHVETKKVHTTKSFSLFRKTTSPESSPKSSGGAEPTKEMHSKGHHSKPFSFFKKATSNEASDPQKKEAEPHRSNEDNNKGPSPETVNTAKSKEVSWPPHGSTDLEENKLSSSSHESDNTEAPVAKPDSTGNTGQQPSSNEETVVPPVVSTGRSETKKGISSTGVKVLPPIVGYSKLVEKVLHKGEEKQTKVNYEDVPAEQETSGEPEKQPKSTDGTDKTADDHIDALSGFQLDVSDTSLEDEVLSHVVYAKVRKTSTASSVQPDPETSSLHHQASAPAHAVKEEAASDQASREHTSRSSSTNEPSQLSEHDGKNSLSERSEAPPEIPAQPPENSHRSKPARRTFPKPHPEDSVSATAEPIPYSDASHKHKPSSDGSVETVSSSDAPLTNQGPPTAHCPDALADIVEKATGKPDSAAQLSSGTSDSSASDANTSGSEHAESPRSALPGVEVTEKNQTTPRDFGRGGHGSKIPPRESATLPATSSPSHMAQGQAAGGDSSDEDDSHDGESEDDDDDDGEDNSGRADGDSPPLPERKYRNQMNKYNEYSNVIRFDSTKLKDARSRNLSHSNLADPASADPSDKEGKLRNAISMEGGLEARGQKPRKTKKPKEAKEEGGPKKTKTPSIWKPLRVLFRHKRKKEKRTGGEEEGADDDNVYEVVDELRDPKSAKQKSPMQKKRKSRDHAPSSHQPLKAVDSSHGSLDIRPIGRLLQLNPDGTQLLELIRPPNGNLGVQLTQGNEETLRGKFVSGFVDKSTEKLLSGILNVGDQILKINDRCVDDCPLIEVHDVIDSQQRLKFLVYPAQ